LIYGSDTWPMKAEHEVKLDRTERSIDQTDMWVHAERNKDKLAPYETSG